MLYERYETQIEARGIGDKPKISEHDEIYRVLSSTLQKIEDEKLVDELSIIDRDGRINYRNELKINEWTQKPEAVKALASEMLISSLHHFPTALEAPHDYLPNFEYSFVYRELKFH